MAVAETINGVGVDVMFCVPEKRAAPLIGYDVAFSWQSPDAEIERGTDRIVCVHYPDSYMQMRGEILAKIRPHIKKVNGKRASVVVHDVKPTKNTPVVNNSLGSYGRFWGRVEEAIAEGEPWVLMKRRFEGRYGWPSGNRHGRKRH
jgi:hypothetical protein